MGSSTSQELIIIAECQSSRHRLDTEAIVSVAGFSLQTGYLDRHCDENKLNLWGQNKETKTEMSGTYWADHC